MSAAPLRRSAPILRLALVTGLTLGLAVVVASVALAVGPGARAAEPVTATVAFVREGGQGSCTSVPTVSSLSVPLGTEVIVANETGRPADLYVGGGSVMRIGNGGGAALTLAAGQHDVRLAPSCLKYADAPSLTVTVVASAPSTTTPSTTGSSTAGSPGDGPPTGPAAPAPSTTPRAQATSSRPGPPGSTRTTATATATATGTASAGADSSVVPASAFDTPSRGEVNGVSTTVPLGVISARPLALPDQDHSKGLRLLAAIATICVLGVTAAIIRAIVRLSP